MEGAMSTEGPEGIRRGYWFVGAAWGGTDDQTSRFVQEGLWENGYDDTVPPVLVKAERACE